MVMNYLFKDENGFEMLVVPCRDSVFDSSQYVLLFKPSKHAKVKTKVVIRERGVCLSGRYQIKCEDGKVRTVSMSGNFYAAGNVFDQRGDSLGPNNLDYYVRPLNFNFDRNNFDVKFSEDDLKKAMQESG